MQKPLSFVAALGLAVTLAMPAKAQDASTVVATVNGTEITIGHMIVARASLPQQYQELPDEVLFTGILDQLIQQSALADSYEGDLPARVAISIENETRSLKAGERLDAALANAITPEIVQSAYDERYSDVKAETEFNASHILVETEEEALALVEALEGGQDFAALAREKSTGPSGPGGGSLGWFGKGAMVPAFEAAVLELEDGSISAPVKTQFGWHVVKRNESREADLPTLDEVRADLVTEIEGTVATTTIEAVIAGATVERADSEGIDPAILKNLKLVE
ncbi:peptidylprolyl isomerase [Pseudosulfitobacter sp. SM2401]|uniref:peptidylprolyl isomerase n=1 Tax=Pseudosulfitobacter sp. SM2401 TaxID=3350098 RepID=UPI0036F2216F